MAKNYNDGEAAIKKFETDIEQVEVITGLYEARPIDKGLIKQHFAALKDRLKVEHRQFEKGMKCGDLADAYKYFYGPAVNQAFVDLMPPRNAKVNDEFIGQMHNMLITLRDPYYDLKGEMGLS